MLKTFTFETFTHPEDRCASYWFFRWRGVLECFYERGQGVRGRRFLGADTVPGGVTLWAGRHRLSIDQVLTRGKCTGLT